MRSTRTARSPSVSIPGSGRGQATGAGDPGRSLSCRRVVTCPYVLGRYPIETRPARIAQANFRVPCRPTATPTMDLDPDCDTPALVGDPERRYSVEVSATALTPGPVEIVFDAGADAADVTPPEHFPGEVDKDGRLGPLTITPLARPEGEYRVSVLQRETAVIERVFRVPCEKPDRVVRQLQPTCGPISPGVEGAYSIRVRGRNFYPGTIELTFDSQGTPETRLATVTDEGTFDALLTAVGRDRGEYTVLARQRDARGTVLRGTRVFTVPCVEPTLKIEPASGPAGYATLVTGTDFPPGTDGHADLGPRHHVGRRPSRRPRARTAPSP